MLFRSCGAPFLSSVYKSKKDDIIDRRACFNRIKFKIRMGFNSHTSLSFLYRKKAHETRTYS